MRKDPNTKIDSELFNKLFLAWKRDNCDKDALISTAEEEFCKELIAAGGETIMPSTIHSWRFGNNPAIGELQMNVLERMLDTSVTLTK